MTINVNIGHTTNLVEKIKVIHLEMYQDASC